MDWDTDKLEHVGQCPLCRSTARKLLHEGLTDTAFNCAPGKWNMQQCLNCATAYLDPRPTQSSMHLAYRTYYTHDAIDKHSTESMTWAQSIRHTLANGYRNWRYGTKSLPSSKIGIIAAYLLPTMRMSIDLSFRYLPHVWPGARLLDVGFGNGKFLEAALSAGWDVTGVDMDPKAVNNARERGLDVQQGGIDVYANHQESFDVITLSHVIEHVYDPVETLNLAFRLLKPGGRLWLDTPNIDSFGHAHFGKHWRGLEPPRHLVLFGTQSIKNALNKSGFVTWKYIDRANVVPGIFFASEEIKLGMKLNDEAAIKIAWIAKCYLIAAKFMRSRGEFINLIAVK